MQSTNKPTPVPLEDFLRRAIDQVKRNEEIFWKEKKNNNKQQKKKNNRMRSGL
jgi:hypothetical protein